MADEITKKLAKNGLGLATHVFDGYMDVSLKLPAEFPKEIPGKKWEKIEPNKLIAIIVREEKKLKVPRDSVFWNVEHGNTGWMDSYYPGQEDVTMRSGEIYVVKRSWLDKLE